MKTPSRKAAEPQARRAGIFVARPSLIPSELHRSGRVMNARTPTVRIRGGGLTPGLMPPLRGWFMSGRVCYKESAPMELGERVFGSSAGRRVQARRAGIFVACQSTSHSSSVGAA